MKCDAMNCEHKIIVVRDVPKKSLIIEANDETSDYYYAVYLDDELSNEGKSRLIYEIARHGEYEKQLSLCVCDD
jgi:hypothetical protein